MASGTAIGAVWRGERRLSVTYWAFGVGGNMAFVAVLLLLWLGGAAREALWAVYLLSLGWFVFVFGAIWRSAARYPGPRGWPLLARLGVLVGVVRMAGEAVLLAMA